MTNWPGIGASSGQGWFAPPDLARPRAPFHRDMPDSPDRDFTPQPAADPERSQLISHCENVGALSVDRATNQVLFGSGPVPEYPIGAASGHLRVRLSLGWRRRLGRPVRRGQVPCLGGRPRAGSAVSRARLSSRARTDAVAGARAPPLRAPRDAMA